MSNVFNALFKEEKMKKVAFLCFMMLTFLLSSQASAATKADIGFVIDQSGSMNSEFSWLAGALGDMDAALTAGGITSVNYGVAGYEYGAGFEDSRNVWQDMSSDFNLVSNALNAASTYGGAEQGYHAAQWAADNFDWTGGDFSKVIILITDEDARDDGGSNKPDLGPEEIALGANMIGDGFLLNVITKQNYYSDWDQAVYNQSTSYQGLFDIEALRTDAAAFSQDFYAAKIKEIQDDPSPGPDAPEPSTWILMGMAFVGLVLYRRKETA